jgi:hypothetical protein
VVEVGWEDSRWILLVWDRKGLQSQLPRWRILPPVLLPLDIDMGPAGRVDIHSHRLLH